MSQHHARNPPIFFPPLAMDLCPVFHIRGSCPGGYSYPLVISTSPLGSGMLVTLLWIPVFTSLLASTSFFLLQKLRTAMKGLHFPLIQHFGYLLLAEFFRISGLYEYQKQKWALVPLTTNVKREIQSITWSQGPEEKWLLVALEKCNNFWHWRQTGIFLSSDPAGVSHSSSSDTTTVLAAAHSPSPPMSFRSPNWRAFEGKDPGRQITLSTLCSVRWVQREVVSPRVLGIFVPGFYSFLDVPRPTGLSYGSDMEDNFSPGEHRISS